MNCIKIIAIYSQDRTMTVSLGGVRFHASSKQK